MVDTRTDYAPDEVAAARAVMLELVRLLGEHRDNMVIVGGWVPELLLPSAQMKHVGSTDVDIALDHRRITEAGYQTIREHLLRHGYVEGKQPYVFFREVPVGGRTITVKKEVFRGKVVNRAHTINTSKAGRREVMKGIGKGPTLDALQDEMMPARGARFKVRRGGPIWGRHKADGATVTYPLPGYPFSGPHQSDESRSGIRIRQSTPSRWRSGPGLHTPWRRPGTRYNLPLGSGWVG